MKALAAFLAVLALALASPAHAVGERVTVIFEIPHRDPVRVDLTYEENVELTHQKINYMVYFWVQGALLKAQLENVKEKKGGAITYTSIGGVANGPEGHWAYWVDGIRSPYHVSSQLSVGVKTIRFRYVKE